jgi:hypothetical protein
MSSEGDSRVDAAKDGTGDTRDTHARPAGYEPPAIVVIEPVFDATAGIKASGAGDFPGFHS